MLHRDNTVHGPKNNSETSEIVMEDEMWRGIAAMEWTLLESSLHLRLSDEAKNEKRLVQVGSSVFVMASYLLIFIPVRSPANTGHPVLLYWHAVVNIFFSGLNIFPSSRTFQTDFVTTGVCQDGCSGSSPHMPCKLVWL